MLITPFDPWKSSLCTCPQKLTLNPYTGCPHGCLYCYVSSYVPDFHHCRPKQHLISRLEKEASKLKDELISIANSSDPYPALEATLGLTRKCLHILSRHHYKLQIITKSNLVTRDIDLLQTTPSMVAISITTDSDKLAELLEPHAPPPTKRLEALEKLIQNCVPASCRIDPIIPHLNDDPTTLIEKLAATGVPQVTCSTYKAKPDNWRRLAQTFPTLAETLQPLYFERGERRGRSLYLQKELRLEIMRKMKILVEGRGMKFSSCREGFPQLNSATCDGSWLIPQQS